MADVGAIRAEVERLLAIYGANRSFRGYAGSFLDLLQVMHSEDGDASAGPPPAVPQDKWPVSMRLRLALGEMALAKRPIPADWAMAWALSTPGHLAANAGSTLSSAVLPLVYDPLRGTAWRRTCGAPNVVGSLWTTQLPVRGWAGASTFRYRICLMSSRQPNRPRRLQSLWRVAQRA